MSGNQDGRRENEATPLGQREDYKSDRQAKETGKREQGTAGPDGPDATEIGDTFKKKS